MSTSGEAAEQIVRISLEGAEFAIRITGAAAKNIAAFLLAALRSDSTDGNTKLMGREQLTNMLKSGRQTKVFAIKNSDLKQFYLEAKRYGLAYCVLKDKKGPPESLVEIMVKEEDAGKVSRIMDRLEFAAVDLASLETAPVERTVPDRDDTDKLLDQLLAKDGRADEPTPGAAKETAPDPMRAGTDKNPPSGPRSKTRSESAEGTRKPESVRAFLRERTAQNTRQRQEPARAEPETKPKSQQRANQHQQPQTAKKKSKVKERG